MAYDVQPTASGLSHSHALTQGGYRVTHEGGLSCAHSYVPYHFSGRHGSEPSAEWCCMR
jgi:hypothetical protein